MLAQDCPPLAPLINHHYKLLIALQNAHDVFFDTLDMLKEKLREIAVEFNLSNRAIK